MNTFSSRPVSTVVVSLAFLALGCKKEPIQYHFQGSITESDNNSALVGAEVEVSQRVYNGTVASSFFNAAGSATIGSDGSYDIVFDREKVFEFKVKVQKPGYFDTEEIIPSSEVSIEEPKVLNYTLDPESWLTFHLVNSAGDVADVMTMVHYNFRIGCQGCTTNDYHAYNGIVDSTFTIKTTGGQYANFARNNPGSAVWLQDSVYMTPFDTVFVNINY